MLTFLIVNLTLRNKNKKIITPIGRKTKDLYKDNNCREASSFQAYGMPLTSLTHHKRNDTISHGLDYYKLC